MLHNHGTFVKTKKLTLVQSSLDIRWGLVPGAPVDTQIRGCSSSLYEMAEYSRLSVSTGPASTDTEG